MKWTRIHRRLVARFPLTTPRKKEQPGILASFALLGLAHLCIHNAASALQAGGGGFTQVVCDGLFCGGNGGNGNPCINSQFCYRVKPNGNPVERLDIGVEDGDLAHSPTASFCGPGGWSMEIVSVARTHHLPPTFHGVETGSSGTCPFVLRFSGPPMTTNFEVGFTYSNPNLTYHDVNWKVNGVGQQAQWSMPVGLNNGPVHSPILTNAGFWEKPFNHAIPDNWKEDYAGPDPMWDGEDQDGGIRQLLAGHMALIPDGPEQGNVLVWSWMRVPMMSLPDPILPDLVLFQHWSIVDVSSPAPSFFNADLPILFTDGDLFCSGHAWTKDGHLLVAGGDLYSNRPTDIDPDPNQLVFRFVPNDINRPLGNSMWQREAESLALARWYPTVTALSTDNGPGAGRDILIVSGGDNAGTNNTYEAFDPSGAPGSGTWQTVPVLGGRVFPGPAGPWPTGAAGTCFRNRLLVYPRPFLLTSGKLFFAGFSGLPYRLDHTDQMNAGQTPTWEIPTTPNDYSYTYTSAFLHPNIGGPNGGDQDRVVRLGGLKRKYNPDGVLSADDCESDPDHDNDGYEDDGETNITESCNASVSNPVWSALPSMANNRLFPNAVLLPDGSTLAFSASHQSGATFVLDAEILNDNPTAPDTWRTAASARVYRGYHSTGVLLPDGRVLIGGGERRQQWTGGPVFGPADYEIFRPHYLTNGTQRPQIQGTPPTVMTYGSVHDLSYASMTGGVTVERVVLMAPGSITHHTDMHQRYVELETVSSEPPTITVQAPPSSTHAPRGFYMLFLVTSEQAVQSGGIRRAPSNAIWVKLE